jgi:RHS repeat-associated protein
MSRFTPRGAAPRRQPDGPRLVALTALVVLLAEPLPASAGVFAGALDSTLTQPPVLGPGQPVPSVLEGLRYGDPTEGVSLIDVPKPDTVGEAHTSFPVDIPPGRLGWQPEVGFEYGSRQGNGWMGVGWDAGAPAITVDTRWGVPRYDGAVESETYSFEGEQLSPTAHRSPQLAREAERIFTKRVEGDYQRIQRHGDSPATYWWEVHDKVGNKYFYGRTPDADVPEAILRADGGAAYWWGLVEKHDISLNTVTYLYDRVEDSGVGDGNAGPKGAQLYLARINYSGSLDTDDDDGPNLPRFGAYDVSFTRDAELGQPRRRDVSIDARTGALRVTSQLLRQVDVTFCPGRNTLNPLQCVGNPELVRSYRLSYDYGPFDKSRLRSVGQAGADGRVFATTEFDYFEDVLVNGNYQGFEDDRTWNTGSGDNVDGALADVKPTALGGSSTSMGDGRIYLGFNPLNPDKGFSIGGGLEMNGSNSTSQIELVDVNGDNLPDKVWKDRGTVLYRLNQGRPGGSTVFEDPPRTLPGLPGLPEEESFGISIGPEAYFFVGDVMYHHGWSFNKATAYFSDVNADGMIDFVRNGTVYFNRLDANKRPVFAATSAGTAIPITDQSISPAVNVDDSAYEAEARQQFPLQDTLRRWIAPWNGEITIEGPVVLRNAPDSPDGVRVAIQKNGGELWSAVIPKGATGPRAPQTGAVTVAKGDRIYFRLQSVDDGAADAVDWDPIVTYTNLEPALDANRLDVSRFVASEEFTLAGRTGIFTQMPMDGTVRVTGIVRKTAATTDDVRIVVEHNGVNLVASTPPIRWDQVGDFPVTAEFPVRPPRTDPSCQHQGELCIVDSVSLRLGVDSPIDVTALKWLGPGGTAGPQLFYVNASKGGQPVRTHDEQGRPIIQLRPPYDISLYGQSNRSTPQSAWTVPDDGDDDHAEVRTIDVKAEVRLTGPIDPSLLPSTVAFTVKGEGRRVAKGILNLRVPPPPAPGPNPVPPFVGDSLELRFQAAENQRLWFDYSSPDPRLGPLMVSDTDADVAGDDIPPADVPVAHHWPLLIVRDDQGDIFPQPFRGWGYAGYNGDGARAGQPVVENDLVFRRSDFKEGVDNRPQNADDTNPIQGKAYPYAPDPEQDRWQGPKQSVRTDDQDLTPRPNIRGATWGGAGGASASRVGPDSVKADGGGAGSGRAPTITGRAEEDTFGGGLAVGPLGFGGGVAFGFSRGMRDFQDMNGDGYPDIVAGKIQYTTQVGGLDPVLRDLDQSAVRTDRSYSGTVSGSGATPSIKSSSNGDTSAASSEDGGGIPGSAGGKDGGGGGGDTGGGGKGKGKSAPKKGQSSSADAPGNGPSGGGGDNADAPGAEEPSGTSAGVNLGFSGSLGHSETNHDDGFNDALPYDPSKPVETDLADLNGDGLPDRVTVDGGEIKVRWNLGFRFSDETTFPGGAIEEGQSDSFSVGASVGFNAGRFDFSGGVNIQKEEEHADIAWIDLNGDGLPDRLESEYTGSPPNVDRHRVSVQFNTGAGLTGPVDFGAFQDHDIARSENFGVSGGADFTIGIGPLCWPVRLCYIILNPGGHGGRSISSTRNSLVDIDGDGLPDSVTSSDDSALHVSRNRTGRTNMLKTIRRPLGARVDLDYERDGNTVDQPFSVWTLNKVTVFDGHAGDGVDDSVTRYDYSDDNYFDFTEREMLGYGTIVEENLDDKGAPYRKFVRTYLNGNYYERGLLESETLQDAAGVAFVSTVNTYELVDSATPEAPVNPTSTVASIFPRKVKVVERWHGAGGAVATQSEIRTTYDARGNAVEIVDLGGPGAGDDAVARTTFTECRTSHADSFPWTQVPQALTIVNAGGQVLRRRDSVSPCDYAAITSMEEHLSAGGDGARARTDVEYADPGGEVNLVIGPENARGDREEMSYEYDRLTGNLVKIAEKGLSLATTMTWDNRFGRLASVTDPNGAVTSFTYDPQGRLTSVTEPLEQGAQPPRRTVTFSYSGTGPDAWVHAEHFDAANPDNKIGTIRFVDGVGKEIQTKQDATVYDAGQKKALDVRVVSGSTYFDFLGRPVRQFYPITEAVSVDIDVFNFNDDSMTPTIVEYDVRDRVTRVTAPRDRVTETTYGFNAGLATTEFLDPEKKRTVTSTDVRGNDVGVERFYAGTSLLTRYEYDPLQQLVGITEAGGARTTVGYDLLGRQLSVETPDAGKVEMGFDLASNMVSKVTPNLRAAGKQITYEHAFNRLVAIRYPNDPSNDVTYAYGRGGAAGNTAGRIAQMVDGARTQDRAYDKAGNLVEQRDVMKVHNLSPTTTAAHTYTTRFAADSMGRILSMTYPDGEVVTNAYDSGGLIRSVAGKKGSDGYRYVDRLEYDKFGFRRLLAYGNGVSTETSYDPATTWLSGQVVTKGTKRLQNLSYTYDQVGNPRTRVDDIPVPKADEMGGPSTQTFTYDDLHRLTGATGTYDFPAKKRRDFSLALTYDPAGRVATKKQVDRIDGREQNGGTFDLSYAYERGQSHGPSKVGSRTYSWDANGNNTGWQEDQGGQRRTITWDEEDRAASIADQGNTTSYRYDDDGTLALERGPQGELEYVNRYFTAVNGGVAWKQFFAGDLQVATKEVRANATEQKRYFLTGDLIGSINLVTEADGDVFEHLEYFPGGQIWVREKSEVYRQPTLYAGMYHDEFRSLYRTQARWYEPRDGVLLSPDPLLTGSPGATVPEPRLLGGYTYSFDNPTRYVDRSGRAPLEALTSFVNGDIPIPFGMKRTMAKRTDFEKSHPKFAKWFGTELDANKTKGKLFKVTDFLDEMYSIEVGIGPKGLKLKRVGVFKKVPKFKGARAFLVRKML